MPVGNRKSRHGQHHTAMTFRLAHLSDPHLGPLPRPRLGELASKRVIGFVNWHRGRRSVHRSEILESLVDDLKAQAPDHIALTGDLVNIALPEEFAAGRRFLEHLGPPADVSAIPGNHDTYVRAGDHHMAAHWSDYMHADDAPGRAPNLPVHFPYLRRRGPLAIIGLSSGITTAPFMATGRIGPQQLEQLSDLLTLTGREGLCRVVLIHHPPVMIGNKPFKRLVDAAAVRHVLAEAGAEVVLHGHEHVIARHQVAGPAGPIPVIGVPSASYRRGSHGSPAGYALYDIDGSPGAWTIRMTRREVTADGFATIETTDL